MKITIFAYSRQGCKTARRIARLLAAPQTADTAASHTLHMFAPARLEEAEFLSIPKPSQECYREQFSLADAILFVGSCGIAVREIAPYVEDKRKDPAVVVIDELGQFVIPLLSGHIGGANALATRLASALNATPVITTATDINHRFSVDSWAAREGFVIGSMGLAKSVSAAILERDLPFCCQLPVTSPLPEGLFFGGEGELGIYVGYEKKKPFQKTLSIIPSILHLGIGCRKGITAFALREAVTDIFHQHGLNLQAVCSVSSIDLKAEEEGLLTFCREQNWPLTCYSAEELKQVSGEFAASAFVQEITGVDNVCERAALLHAGTQKLQSNKGVHAVRAALVLKKTAICGVTIAVAAEYREVSFG